jgi:hypothetical protein
MCGRKQFNCIDFIQGLSFFNCWTAFVVLACEAGASIKDRIRGFSLRAGASIKDHIRGFDLRSRRQHKAWGASPRITKKERVIAREAGDSQNASRRRPLSRARGAFNIYSILGLAPQALCFDLLRRLTQNTGPALMS